MKGSQGLAVSLRSPHEASCFGSALQEMERIFRLEAATLYETSEIGGGSGMCKG